MKIIKEYTKNYTTASKVSMTTFIFLAMAPVILIWYALYIYNFNNIDNVFLYIIQVIADTISMMVLLGLWVTILIDVIVERHHRVYINKKARESAEANKQADNPVRGHDDVVAPLKEAQDPNRLLDVKA